MKLGNEQTENFFGGKTPEQQPKQTNPNPSLGKRDTSLFLTLLPCILQGSQTEEADCRNAAPAEEQLE